MKAKTVFVCQQCGYEAAKWLGRCPSCGEWNTFVEEMTVKPTKSGFRAEVTGECIPPQPIMSVNAAKDVRLVTEWGEFDRVMGGGIVPGSLFLVGGDPGIGKSTLLLQVANRLSQRYGTVLYVSGEESLMQTRLRAERIGSLSPALYLLAETNLETIVRWAQELHPVLVVVDSIQTVFTPLLPTAPGSVGQIRECAGILLRLAKTTSCTLAVIGHVTKDGNIAGPRLLEHMVDAVLYFEGERHHTFRILRAVKNRFGSTHESGIFAMTEQGLAEVLNPSQLFLAERPLNVPGSVVVACADGSRPLLVEIQALVSPTCFGMPRRMAAGVDYNRLNLLLAVLEKKIGLHLQDKDAYINVAGGIKVDEPAVDLGVVLAVASSFRNIAADPNTVVMGEVGLTGEVRAVTRIEIRIQEAARLGFRQCIIPQGGVQGVADRYPQIVITPVSNVLEAMEAALGGLQ